MCGQTAKFKALNIYVWVFGERWSIEKVKKPYEPSKQASSIFCTVYLNVYLPWALDTFIIPTKLCLMSCQAIQKKHNTFF